MSNVVPFRRKSEEIKQLDAVGEAFCLACNHTWSGVAPVGTQQLECPACHRVTGHWKFEFYPPPGTEVRECDCSNQLFYLTRQGHMCASCGVYQQYD